MGAFSHIVIYSFVCWIILNIQECSSISRAVQKKVLLEASMESLPDSNTPFEKIIIGYKGKKIPGWIVISPHDKENRGIILFHGWGGSLSDWKKVQSKLYKNHISSLAFNYSDMPEITRLGESGSSVINDVRHITSIATDSLRKRLHGNPKIYLCGHSLGNGVMLDSYKYMDRSNIQALILCNPSSSIRDWLIYKKYMPAIFRPLIIYGFYNNKKLIKEVYHPILWVHSHADKTTPVWMGQQIFDRAQTSKKYILYEQFGHNYILDAKDDYWNGILDYMNAFNNITTNVRENK